MSRSSFKPLNVSRLARVFVAILATIPPDQQAELCKAFIAVKELAGASPTDLARRFHEILLLPRERRVEIAEHMNSIFEDLLEQDFFGTEGQLDPRGDHRD
jgi:hypothetical protein